MCLHTITGSAGHLDPTVQADKGRPAGEVAVAEFLKRRTCSADPAGDTSSVGLKHSRKMRRRRVECFNTSSGSITRLASLPQTRSLGTTPLNAKRAIGSWSGHSFLLGTKSLSRARSHMSARCCRPRSPSKKQLGTIIATYKWISSMIKMFRVGEEGASGTHGQVVVISAAVAVGFRSKRAKERKTRWAVYSGARVSGQVLPLPPPALSLRVHPISKDICPLIPL